MSPTEMLIVGVIAVLLFGSKLPSVARSAGKSLTELKRGMRDAQDEFRRTMHEVDSEPPKAPQLSAQPADASDHSDDDNPSDAEPVDSQYATASDESVKGP